MYQGRFPFNEPKVSKIWKQQQMVQKFSRKIPETVEFPKGEQLSRKFKKFREQSWMEIEDGSYKIHDGRSRP